jgi:hypothetical protein
MMEGVPLSDFTLRKKTLLQEKIFGNVGHADEQRGRQGKG